MASTRIGADMLYYATMTTEDTATSPPSFATPVRIMGLISANINPNGSISTLFADDGPFETATTLGDIEVELEFNIITPQIKAALLGHTLDSNGALVYSSSDVPPYVAIGFRTLKANGMYRYLWLYKGRFIDPEDNNTTKGETIEWNTETITGQFAKLSNTFSTGNRTNVWKYEIDAETATGGGSIISTWFQSVKLPS